LQYTIKGGLIYVQPTIARYRAAALHPQRTRPCHTSHVGFRTVKRF
jgi:hypothetical protein